MRSHSSLSAAVLALTVLTHPLAAQHAPPTRNDPASHWVRLQDGTRLHYVESGPQGAASLVLIHGYSDSWYSFSRVIPKLSERYHVVAIDLRGHGESDRPAGGYSPVELATDVSEAMQRIGITKATVVGHSLGSLVAQQLAASSPEQVERLVLVGAGRSIAAFPGLTEFSREVMALSDPVSDEFIRAFQSSTIHAKVPSSFYERVVRESHKLPVHVWHAVLEGMQNTGAAERLPSRGIPTLVIWGEHDQVFPRAEQDSLVRWIGTALLVTHTDVGHAPHWERPKDFVRDLVSFIENDPL